MKAAVFYGKGDIRVDNNYPMPKVGPQQVLLRVKACGVCGTDVHIHAGAQGATECEPPVILGHEFAGEVVEIGSAVTRVKVGDHVTVNPNIACEACDQCRCGNVHFCDTMTATGVNHDMTGILVLSGEATMEDVAVSDVKPHLIFDKLSDMIPYLD